MSDSARLAAEIDGAALSDEEARALWKEFSEHMDAHRGDVAGFAKQKALLGIRPEYREGRAVLVGWRNAPPPAPPARAVTTKSAKKTAKKGGKAQSRSGKKKGGARR